MTAGSPNRRYSGHHKATEEEGDQGILVEEIWRKKCGQTAGYKYSWRKMEAAAQDRAGWRQVVKVKTHRLRSAFTELQ